MSASYPPAPQLTGARAKLEHAGVHAGLIRDEILRVTGPEAYSVVQKVENGGKSHTWFIEGLKAFDTRLPLWIGDCMHNLRSAWDHIAYELVRQVPNLQPTERTTFPLLARAPKVPVYILPAPGPHVDAMTIVDDAQPYRAGGEANPLAILRHLDIVDKHRELLAVAAAVDVPYYGSPKDTETLGSWAWGGVVHDGHAVMGAVIEPARPGRSLDGHVVLTTKLSEDLLPMPLADAPSLDNLIDDIAGQLSWRLAEFDRFFATH